MDYYENKEEGVDKQGEWEVVAGNIDIEAGNHVCKELGVFVCLRFLCGEETLGVLVGPLLGPLICTSPRLRAYKVE